jgi:diazepam-binding inhibitor (GABA receptor modulator, acyl-CoA-binding protein)
MTDMVGFAKWSAWNKLKGQTQVQAQQAYIDLVNELLD